MSIGIVFEQEEMQRLLEGVCHPVEERDKKSYPRKRKKILILAGPTGCGKTKMSLLLAKRMRGEILSADSMQIYKGMNIGTAKADRNQRLSVPHHLIDIREINEPFNVVDFYYEARHVCEQILSRGNVPVVVGGSGFYLHTFLYGPPSGPPSIDLVRQSIQLEMDQKGSDVLYDKLKELDPEYAKTITKHDQQKIVRALEIIQLTHDKVSSLEWTNKKRAQDYDFICWFLHRPRDVLYRRIEQRCEEMVAQGLFNEVQELSEKGLDGNRSASQAIGYRQATEYLLSGQTEADYQEFLTKFKIASRRYAKRQFTWFRKEPLFRWFDIENYDFEIAADLIYNDFMARL